MLCWTQERRRGILLWELLCGWGITHGGAAQDGQTDPGDRAHGRPREGKVLAGCEFCREG